MRQRTERKGRSKKVLKDKAERCENRRKQKEIEVKEGLGSNIEERKRKDIEGKLKRKD